MVTIAVNRKEYFEGFKSKNLNKKHKDLRKGALGVELEDYAKRINSIREMENLSKSPQKN